MVTLQTPCSSFARGCGCLAHSPETVTSVALGARSRKVTRRSGSTPGEMTGGGAVGRAAGASGRCVELGLSWQHRVDAKNIAQRMENAAPVLTEFCTADSIGIESRESLATEPMGCSIFSLPAGPSPLGEATSGLRTTVLPRRERSHWRSSPEAERWEPRRPRARRKDDQGLALR